MEEIIVGVVGVLRFGAEIPPENEYNVDIILENLPYRLTSAGSRTKRSI